MKTDSQTTVQELKDLMSKFSDERGWGRHHTPKNLAISICLEGAELLEHFQWEEYENKDKQAMAEELSDIMSYILMFATVMDIDKLKKAAIKYPTELFNKDRIGAEDFKKIKKDYRKGKK
jgi:NTP pyrophosphatase (non-canonical NTP hydrolase)